jgi:hypothetical protein
MRPVKVGGRNAPLMGYTGKSWGLEQRGDSLGRYLGPCRIRLSWQLAVSLADDCHLAPTILSNLERNSADRII